MPTACRLLCSLFVGAIVGCTARKYDLFVIDDDGDGDDISCCILDASLTVVDKNKSTKIEL